MIDRAKAFLARIDSWLTAHRTTRVARRAVLGFLANNALQHAGSMAYFAVLSLFQLLVLAIVVGSFVLGEGAAREFVLDQVEAGSPLDREMIAEVIDSVIESRGGITIISFAFLAWSSLGIFSALSSGISLAFENAPPRPFLKDKLIGLLLIGVTGILAIGALAIGLVTGVLQEAAQGVIGDVPGGSTAIWLIGLIAPLILIGVAFWIIYRVVPNRPVTWKRVLPGAVVATLLWTILRFGFTWYVTSVANYESAFGPISTAVTLLVFLYFASAIVLLGAEFAQASVVDREEELAKLGAGAGVGAGAGAASRPADPALLPVPLPQTPQPVLVKRRGPSKWIVLAGGALAGLIAGRLSKRDDD